MALVRISDFLSDADPLLLDFWTPPHMAFSKATNLAFMLVRYRFSMMLCAARFAALRPLVVVAVVVWPVLALESTDVVRVILRLTGGDVGVV